MTYHRISDIIIEKEIKMDLKKLREEKKISQASLAKAAGIAQSTVCYIETGKKNPSIKTVIKLANALDLDLNNLIKS